MEQINTMGISLTPEAVKQLALIREQEKVAENKLLRLGVKGGGCSGLSYVLEYDEKKDFDKELEFGGIKIVIDKRHELYIAGMEVDYQAGLNDRGFIFNNPNAKESCGCGTSFST